MTKAAGLLIVAAVLAAVASLAPLPAFLTDKDVYEQMSREWFIPACDDLQCFRVLVPWTLGAFPGSGYLKWRIYAVVCEAFAAWAMGRWVLAMGGSRRAATQTVWLTALGSGSLYTLFDPFTADPLMHAIGPALMLLLMQRRILFATIVAGIGVFGKEFAAVPLWVAGAAWFLERRFEYARSTLLAGVTVVGVWAAWQLLTRTMWNYSTVNSHSADLFSGGFIVFWLANLGPALVVVALVAVFGGLWLIWPAGVFWGSPQLTRLTIAGIVPLLVFNYLQQPDRALWNFAFLVMPAAAVVLDRVPPATGWLLVAAQALVNFRVGAQLAFMPPIRVTLTVALMISAVMVWRARTSLAANGVGPFPNTAAIR